MISTREAGVVREHVEEYLGAIYRLRATPEAPLPLAQLGEYFNFSPVSIHEMIRKLATEAWVVYHPYRGVTLTAEGETLARSLVRRHRLWERFLTDMLDIPWDEAHAIAGQLEHAAPGTVTDRLAHLLGDPQHCPHGAPIPPQTVSPAEVCLWEAPLAVEGRVSRITPETPELLTQAQAWGLLPGARVTVLERQAEAARVQIAGQTVSIPAMNAHAIRLVVNEE